MAILNHRYTKINAEIKEFVADKISVNNNLKITKINERKQEQLEVNYEFKVDYQPNVGEILIEGKVIYLTDKNGFEFWKKNNRLQNKDQLNIMNFLLDVCNIKALNLSQELGLPPCIPLPKAQITEEKEVKSKKNKK